MFLGSLEHVLREVVNFVHVMSTSDLGSGLKMRTNLRGTSGGSAAFSFVSPASLQTAVISEASPLPPLRSDAATAGLVLSCEFALSPDIEWALLTKGPHEDVKAGVARPRPCHKWTVDKTQWEIYGGDVPRNPDWFMHDARI